MQQTIDLKALNRLIGIYHAQPKVVRRACAMLLNDLAFGTKYRAADVIGDRMTVRAPAFVKGRIRVTKTSGALPVSRQVSQVGSVAIPRGTPGRGPFTGWTEQEFGGIHARFATLAARGGTNQGKIRPSSRLKPGMEAVTIEDYNPRGGSRNYGGFLAMLFRKKERRLVRIKGGFYKLPRATREIAGPGPKGGALHRALVLQQALKKHQPKRVQWMLTARKKYVTLPRLQTLWSKHMRTAGAFKLTR